MKPINFTAFDFETATVAFEVSNDEFIKMGLKDKVIQVLNR
jgi:hypothetical protein